MTKEKSQLTPPKYKELWETTRQIRSDQSLSRVQLFAIPWIAACQAFLSITNSQSSLRLTSIESVMPSSHLILCHPLLLLPPIPPSIRDFPMEFQLSYSKSWKMMLWNYCTQYASKFRKLSSGHRTGKGQFSFQSQRKAMPNSAQTTTQLHSSHTLVR